MKTRGSRATCHSRGLADLDWVLATYRRGPLVASEDAQLHRCGGGPKFRRAPAHIVARTGFAWQQTECPNRTARPPQPVGISILIHDLDDPVSGS
jgi:hypothetical protein